MDNIKIDNTNTINIDDIDIDKIHIKIINIIPNNFKIKCNYRDFKKDYENHIKPYLGYSNINKSLYWERYLSNLTDFLSKIKIKPSSKLFEGIINITNNYKKNAIKIKT